MEVAVGQLSISDEITPDGQTYRMLMLVLIGEPTDDKIEFFRIASSALDRATMEAMESYTWCDHCKINFRKNGSGTCPVCHQPY